jgi:hydroxyacylglutathione hydrolase
MTPQEVQAVAREGAIVLDMRPPKPFAKEHVAGAVNIQFNRTDLADRAEMSLPADERYVVHAEPEPIAKAAVDILQMAGFTVLGYLEGGLKGWKTAGLPTAELPLIDVDQLKARFETYRVLDARERFEYKYAHIPNAELLEWTAPWDTFLAVDDSKPLALVCGDQVRSAYVASVLLRAGKNASLVFGGMVDWTGRGYPVEKS